MSTKAPSAEATTTDALMATVVKALNKGGKYYTGRCIGPNKYHVKCGHLTNNVLFGCCGQCYKYDIDFMKGGSVKVVSTVPCNGFWGGLIGAWMESDEKKRVSEVLAREFPDKRVYVSEG
jgi:hypothetical protein